MTNAGSRPSRRRTRDGLLPLGLSLAIGAALASGACASRIPVPPTGPHQHDTPVLVPYPPPPARVEVIPDPPEPEALWIDGHWVWTAGGYAWQPGHWDKPRPGAHYAPATMVRRRNGELLYYVGAWQGGGPPPATSDAKPSQR